mmetsp:Transcript_36937/g.81064  ORF Transcript_36937/g.81064 Transcript_36937/m.81064 type:complete len:236 (-) Transcript_36937:1117-1824(-)
MCTAGCFQGVDRSSAFATRRRVASCQWSAMRCRPMGSDVVSSYPTGTEIPGFPRRLQRKMCFITCTTNAALLSPTGFAAGGRNGAVVPATGDTYASTLEKTFLRIHLIAHPLRRAADTYSFADMERKSPREILTSGGRYCRYFHQSRSSIELISALMVRTWARLKAFKCGMRTSCTVAPRASSFLTASRHACTTAGEASSKCGVYTPSRRPDSEDTSLNPARWTLGGPMDPCASV